MASGYVTVAAAPLLYLIYYANRNEPTPATASLAAPTRTFAKRDPLALVKSSWGIDNDICGGGKGLKVQQVQQLQQLCCSCTYTKQQKAHNNIACTIR